LVNVATFCAPMPPTATETQLMLVGLTVAVPLVDDTPVPVNTTFCGLPEAESVKLNVALRLPATVGLNTTDAEHVAEAARLVPHDLLEMLKSAGFVPVIATLLMLMEVVVPLDRVADFALLLEPRLMLPYERLVGLTDTVPDAGAPYPVSATVWGLLLAESVNCSVAERFPVVVGAKIMLAVQLEDAASDELQVLLKISKSPGFAPPNAMLLIEIAVVPPLVSVTSFCAPLPPTGTETQFSAVGETDTWAVSAAQGAIRQAAPSRIASRLFLFGGTDRDARVCIRHAD
jgi:hypothetical protein